MFMMVLPAGCARHCVMACYHAIIPLLCPEIAGPQQAALKKTIPMPLVSTNALVDNVRNLGVFAAYCWVVISVMFG